jgi:SpoVK/Ycf46/Vps4 family AAA+-type ATPase
MPAPYGDSREHLLDEIAICRARAIQHAGAKDLVNDAPPPDPALVAERVQLSLAAGVDLRLARVEATFGLSLVERTILVNVLASEVDPLFRAVCRGLQGEMSGPTLQVGTIVELVAPDLDAAVDAALLFLPEKRLRTNALITVEDPLAPRDVPLQALRVKIDRNLALYLLGARASSAPSYVTVVEPRATLDRARLPPERKADLVAFLARRLEERRPPLVEIVGPPGVGKKFLAEGVCHALGRPMLVVDGRGLAASTSAFEVGQQLPARLAEVRREAMLRGAIPYLDHYAALLNRHESVRVSSGDPDTQAQTVAPTPVLTMPPELATFLSKVGLCFLGGDERFEPLDQAGEVVRLALPFPTPRQRADIWDQTFTALGATLDEDVDLLELGRKLALDGARIQAAAKAAAASAAVRAEARRGPTIITRADVIDASRHQLQHDLKSLAVRIDKAYRWEDLVISVDGYHALTEMIAYAANAEKVYDQWGFAAKHSVATGISALFSGPPGTGKTMCASVIARELDMELFRVDLSRVVSKWIGETEKNLARVFDEADRSHAVILFDEADSLFAKRTEVKSSVDRYANLEVNFLLQRMESFNGITILTTNFEDTIDSAFKRRLTFRIRFEKPDADARAALWEKMFPPTAELAPDVDFGELGRRFEISGGNIRNAAIRAAFLAVSEGHAIDMDTLIRAAVREAREMGVLIADPALIARAERDRNAALMAPPPPEAAAGGDGEPEQSPPPSSPKPSPRLVPITRPR